MCANRTKKVAAGSAQVGGCREAEQATRHGQLQGRAQRGAGSGETLLQLSVKHKQGVQSQWTETRAGEESALSFSLSLSVARTNWRGSALGDRRGVGGGAALFA